jgi:8-oxo-dGTP pyrophosphatase MutT (NUDIX family)
VGIADLDGEGIMQVEERRAVRAIILTPDKEVLLFRLRPPGGTDCFWIAPGGDINPGETAEMALRRELLEELGLVDFEIGALVWRRHHTFDWGVRRISQREDYRIVEVARFIPVMTDEVEAEYVVEHRWWPLSDLERAEERLTPLSLPAILARYLADGAPDPLPAEEVLIDVEPAARPPG